MTSTQFKNEKLYLATMSIVKKMLVDELISLEEYRQIDTIFKEKYLPTLGELFCRNA